MTSPVEAFLVYTCCSVTLLQLNRPVITFICARIHASEARDKILWTFLPLHT